MSTMLNDTACQVITKLENWDNEGRVIEFWTRGQTGSYLCQLLGNDVSAYHAWEWLVKNKHETLKALAGPHGWTCHQMLVARYKERIKMEEKQFDTKHNTGLQID